MPEVKHIYVYQVGSDPEDPPAPLLSDVTGNLTPPNLYTITAAANNANLVINQHYDMTISAMSRTNPGTPATCNAVAPPHYVFIT